MIIMIDTLFKLSYIINNVKHSYDTISSTASEHVSTVAEINREGSSRQVSDLSAWFEHVVTIKNFDFIDT
jgi:methyl-accepting chemotaxis protein